MKIFTSFVAIFSILLIVPTGASLASDAGSLCAKRFMIGLQGTPDADLSLDIIALSYDDRREGMEITLRNWETLQYKYSDGNLLVPGTQVSLFNGCSSANGQKMSEGRIASVAPGFHRGEPSTIVVSVRGAKSILTRKQVNVDYGGSLLEFYPVLKDGTIEGKGTTTGLPDLRTGATLTINGVGQRYTGAYSITGTIHTFDNTKGYTTQFTVQKAAGRIRTSSVNEIHAWPNDVRNKQ